MHPLFNHAFDLLQGKAPIGKLRDNRWRAFRAHHIKDACEVCGRSDNLELHHIHPFHDHPERELDPTNVITLCESGTNCHLNYGHAGDFKGYNPDVKADAPVWQKKFERSRQLAKHPR